MNAADERHRREAVREAIRRLASGRRLTRRDLFHGSKVPLAHPEEWERKILKRLVDTGMFERKNANNPSHVTYRAIDDLAIDALADNDRFITDLIWPAANGLPMEGDAEDKESLSPPTNGESQIIAEIRAKEPRRVLVTSSSKATSDAPGDRMETKTVRTPALAPTGKITFPLPEPPAPPQEKPRIIVRTSASMPAPPEPLEEPPAETASFDGEGLPSEDDLKETLLKLSYAATENMIYMRDKLDTFFKRFDAVEKKINELHAMWKA